MFDTTEGAAASAEIYFHTALDFQVPCCNKWWKVKEGCTLRKVDTFLRCFLAMESVRGAHLPAEKI